MVQEKLREIEFEICKQYGVTVADIYDKLDTSDTNKKNDYTFDNLAGNGLPGNVSCTFCKVMVVAFVPLGQILF